MSNIRQELANLLTKVQEPGSFYAKGQVETQMFSLAVKDVGSIALPLLPQQADTLIHHAEQAPFGRGEATLLDTSVRNTKQFDADQVSIHGKGWQSFLETVLMNVKQQLGVKTQITAELYKLLVYETGGFFINHRDTEKTNGMFATLIISLPSNYTGGELRVEHAGESVSIDLQNDDPSLLSYAAFYADCVHEVLPVTSGCRLVLVYNLCRQGMGELPKPPSYLSEQAQITRLLKGWTGEIDESLRLNNSDVPFKLVYLLEHAYTPEGVAFEQLKNKDQAVAEVLIPAAQDAECEVFLTLMTIEESGAAEERYDHNRYRRKKSYRYDDYDDEDEGNGEDDDFEVIEVYDSYRRLEFWTHPTLGLIDDELALSFSDEELSPPNCLLGLTPDEQYFHEDTGNAGASFERTYRRAALVLWPRIYSIPILMLESHEAVLFHLYPLLTKWQDSGAQPLSDSGQQLHKSLKKVVSLWNKTTPRNDNQRALAFEGLLDMVSVLQDSELLQETLDLLLEDSRNYSVKLNSTLAEVLTDIPPEKACSAVSQIISTDPKHTFNYINLVKLLIDANFAKHDWFTQSVAPLLTAVVQNIPQQNTYRNDPFTLGYGYEASGVEASQARLQELLQVFACTDIALGKQMVEALFANLKRFNPYTLLLDTALHICSSQKDKSELIEYFIARGFSYLDNRINQPLSAPTNWTREVNFDTNVRNEDAQAFAAFLRDPDLAEWSFKAIQEKRNRLSYLAENYKSDVDMTTIKKGSPHILHFTKNQASYERRVLERERDEDYRKRLANQN